MTHLLAAILATAITTATESVSVDATVLRLHSGNGKILLCDGVGEPYEVCIVTPTEYAFLTGQVAQVWQSLNADESGRSRLHGRRVSQIYTNDTRVTVYADGYHWTDKMTKAIGKRSKAVDSATGKTLAAEAKAYANKAISERHRKMREELAARRNAKAREITVEYDATTGKETEVTK